MAAALLCPVRTWLLALRSGRIGKHLLTLIYKSVLTWWQTPHGMVTRLP